MKSKEKLKSCPFCGSRRLEVARTNAQACWIACETCDANTKSDPTRAGAIRNWNKRRPLRAEWAKVVFDMEAPSVPRRNEFK